MQTAVEMYHYKIKSIIGNWTPLMIEIFEQTYEQAKQMEEKQRKDEYLRGYVEGIDSGSSYHPD